MTLQVEFQDLRRMLKEKCEDIIKDQKLADEFYRRICEIEEDERFVVVKNKKIGYDEKADALLKMWMDDDITDYEYGKIMGKLNKGVKV